MNQESLMESTSFKHKLQNLEDRGERRIISFFYRIQWNLILAGWAVTVQKIKSLYRVTIVRPWSEQRSGCSCRLRGETGASLGSQNLLCQGKYSPRPESHRLFTPPLLSQRRAQWGHLRIGSRAYSIPKCVGHLQFIRNVLKGCVDKLLKLPNSFSHNHSAMKVSSLVHSVVYDTVYHVV